MRRATSQGWEMRMDGIKTLESIHKLVKEAYEYSWDESTVNDLLPQALNLLCPLIESLQPGKPKTNGGQVELEEREINCGNCNAVIPGKATHVYCPECKTFGCPSPSSSSLGEGKFKCWRCKSTSYDRPYQRKIGKETVCVHDWLPDTKVDG